MYEPHTARETFQVGFSKNPRLDFGIYAKGYFGAAELLVESALAKPSFPDYEAYPIMFLYRQAVELDLKGCIYNSAHLANLMEVPHLDHSLVNNHDLSSLARRAKSITDVLFKGDQELSTFMSSVTQEVGQIMRIDPKSFAFRYPLKRNGAPSFENTHFGLESTRKRISSLHYGLQSIHFGLQVTEEQRLEIYELLTGNEC
jgi:hypothetical protein